MALSISIEVFFKGLVLGILFLNSICVLLTPRFRIWGVRDSYILYVNYDNSMEKSELATGGIEKGVVLYRLAGEGRSFENLSKA